MTDLVWHYTANAESHLGSILRDGLIKVESSPFIDVKTPAVWFSSNQLYEATALKLRRSAAGIIREESLAEFLREAARIGVDREGLLSWSRYKRVAMGRAADRLAEKQFLKGLEEAGLKAGAKPAEWFASLNAVPRHRWRVVEVQRGGRWVPVSN